MKPRVWRTGRLAYIDGERGAPAHQATRHRVLAEIEALALELLEERRYDA